MVGYILRDLRRGWTYVSTLLEILHTARLRSKPHALLFQPFLRFYRKNEVLGTPQEKEVSTLLEILEELEKLGYKYVAKFDVSTLLEILAGNRRAPPAARHATCTVSTLLEILVHLRQDAPGEQRVVFQPFLRF